MTGNRYCATSAIGGGRSRNRRSTPSNAARHPVGILEVERPGERSGGDGRVVFGVADARDHELPRSDQVTGDSDADIAGEEPVTSTAPVFMRRPKGS